MKDNRSYSVYVEVKTPNNEGAFDTNMQFYYGLRRRKYKNYSILSDGKHRFRVPNRSIVE